MSKKKKTMDELLEEAIIPEKKERFEIPGNWIWTRTGSITDVIGGGTPKSTVKEYFEDGDIPWLTPADLSGYQGMYISRGKRNITEVGLANSSAKILPSNTVLLSSRAPIGYVTIASNDICTNQGFKSFVPSNAYYPEYLYWYLKFSTTYLESMASGTTFKELSGSKCKEIVLPLPPLNEQKRIAKKVERLLIKIDEAKLLIEEAKETFELRREAILDKAFRGELTAEWREKNLEIESGVMRLEKIKNERFQIVESKRELSEIAIMFDELNTEECIDNNNWLYLKANMFCYNINCGGTPSKDITEKGEIPFLKVYNIVENKVSFSYKPQYIPKEVHESKLKKSILKPNDVIMNIVGPPLKKIAIIPEEYPEMNMNQAIVRFRSTKYVLPKYLYFCLQYDETLKEVINETRGVVGQSNISISQSRNLVMPIPSLEEQAVIVNKLEELIEREEVVLNLISDKKNLEELKQSILSKAFRGELGTNDPREENAIELLKEVLQEQVK